MKSIFVTSIFLILIIATFGQSPDSGHKDKWEKYRSEKVAYLTTNLELTPDEAQRFWPLYNQLEKERWEAQKQRREMESKVLEAKNTMSDARIMQLTRDFAGSLRKEADMLSNYNEKFLEVLPPRKVLELYKTENEFRMYMIKKYRDKRRNGE